MDTCTMEQTILDRLTLAQLPDLGPRGRRELLARGALADTLAHPEAHADVFSAAARARLRTGEARREARASARSARARGARIVGLGAADYPAWLARTFDPPPALFVKGVLVPDEGARAVALVGSRAATPLGLAFARTLGRDLARAGVTVVSGLARGIDAAAHRGALDAGGRTVAILGSGLARVYPSENRELAASIVATRGALVSEFPMNAAPLKGNFPRRNRVIAGWGRAVVVVEAGEKSGALITARLALEEGREVMAVPGHPTWTSASGANALLGDGAALVRNAGDVLEELDLAPALEVEKETTVQDEVLVALKPDAPSSVDEILSRSGLGLPELLARLGELELAQQVRRLPGPLFVRS